MKQVRTSSFYIHDDKTGFSLISNIDIVQAPELEVAYGQSTHVCMVEYFFEIDHICYYMDNRKVIVDTWGSLRSVFMTELVEGMFKSTGWDMVTKDDVVSLIDRMFKNDYGHSTPLMLAAEHGLPNTVH